MNIIVTRPEEDAWQLAAKLKALGHVPMIMPLLKIVARPNIKIPNKVYQAICLTSANGVRSLSDITNIELIPVVAVGAQTLVAARKAGFLNVVAEGGDVSGLVSYIEKTYHQSSGPILYVSGAETSGDLEGKLRLAGFQVDRMVTYDAIPARLSTSVNQILQAHAVVLYSPRSAKIWRTEIERLQLEENINQLKHICLSANVAAALPQSWHTSIAKAPTETELLVLLDYSRKAE
jgi:uroporphyrinogen-III synthase